MTTYIGTIASVHWVAGMTCQIIIQTATEARKFDVHARYLVGADLKIGDNVSVRLRANGEVVHFDNREVGKQWAEINGGKRHLLDKLF